MDLKKELLNFQYREISLPLENIFPRLDRREIAREFAHLKKDSAHETVLNVARELWNGGYNKILERSGFYEEHYASFSGHCHQCTPALGVVLQSLGFENVSYLECFRIREHFPKTGLIEQVPPSEEQNNAMKEEFCSIKRIPYCCLEIKIDDEFYYLTGKHVKPKGEETVALLSAVCYRDFVGVFRHQLDPSKSGIYLRTIQPLENPTRTDFSKRVVWTKQTERDSTPEYFATFLRMKLE